MASILTFPAGRRRIKSSQTLLPQSDDINSPGHESNYSVDSEEVLLHIRAAMDLLVEGPEQERVSWILEDCTRLLQSSKLKDPINK